MCCKLHTEKNGSQGLRREVCSPLPGLLLTSTSLICTVKTPGERGYALSPCLYSMFYKHKPKRTVSHLKWIYMIRNYLVVGAGKWLAQSLYYRCWKCSSPALCPVWWDSPGWWVWVHVPRQASSTPSQSPERNEHSGYKLAQPKECFCPDDCLWECCSASLLEPR